MKTKKTTLSDLQQRKAATLAEIKETRLDLEKEVHALTHPFSSSNSMLSQMPSLSTILTTAKRAYLAYRIANKIIAFFRRR